MTHYFGYPSIKPACCILLAGLLANCGNTKARLRTLPPEIMAEFSRTVDLYDSDIPKNLAKVDPKQKRKVLAFMGALSKENHKRFTHDPRLDKISEIYARAWGEHETAPARGLIEWMMRKAGMTGSMYDTGISWSSGRNVKKRFTNRIRMFAKKFESKGDRYSFGIAQVKIGQPSKFGQAIIVVENATTVHRLKKHYEPGEQIVIRGKINIPHDYTLLNMTLGERETLRIPVRVADDGKFLVKIPAPTNPGRHFLRIKVRREPGWLGAALSIPIYVGVKESSHPDDILLNPPPNPKNRDQWPEYLLGLYNAKRAEHHLPPIILSTKLSEWAADHARELEAEEKYYLSYDDVDARLRSHGYQADSQWRVRPRFESLAELVWTQMQDPSFYAMLFNDRLGEVGLGFHTIKDGYGKGRLVAYFVSPTNSKLSLDTETYKALSQSVTSYDDPQTIKTSTAGETQFNAQAKEIEAVVNSMTKAEFKYDPRLNVVARELATSGKIVRRAHHWILRKLGILGSISGKYRRLVEAAQTDKHVIAKIAANINYLEEDESKRYIFGLAWTPRKDQWLNEGIVVLEKSATFETIAKKYEVSSPLVIKGKMLIEPKSPEFLMTRAGRDVYRQPIQVDSHGNFKIETFVPKEPGRYFIQITNLPVEYDEKEMAIVQWSNTVLLAPVYVGIKEPINFDNMVIDPPSETDEEKLSTTLLDIYNKERAKYELQPITTHPVANALIKDRLSQAHMTIDPPSLLTVGKELRDNGVGVTIGGVSLSTSRIFEKAWRNLQIPSRRSVILSKEVTMAGIVVDMEDGVCEGVLLSADLPTDFDVEGRFKFTASKMISPLDDSPIGHRSQESINKVVAAQLEKIAKCYHDDLKYYKKLGGKLTVQFVIGVTGEVIASSLDSSTLRNEDIENCIVQEIRTWEFLKSFSNEVVIEQLTFDLQPSRLHDGTGTVRVVQ